MEIPRQSGNYVITAHLAGPLVLFHHTLGEMHLSPGNYFYCGSAHGPGGLYARLRRHLDHNAPKFWHFDYLKEHIHIQQIWWQVERENRECEALQVLLEIEKAQVPVIGFGAGDCHRGCPAHLVCFPLGIDIQEIHKFLEIKHLVLQQWDAQGG